MASSASWTRSTRWADLRDGGVPITSTSVTPSRSASSGVPILATGFSSKGSVDALLDGWDKLSGEDFPEAVLGDIPITKVFFGKPSASNSATVPTLMGIMLLLKGYATSRRACSCPKATWSSSADDQRWL